MTDHQAAEHARQLDLRRDLAAILVKIAPHLSDDEMALLEWATGLQPKEITRVLQG